MTSSQVIEGCIPFNNLRGSLLRGAAGFHTGENLLKVAPDPTSSNVLGHKAPLLICRHGVVFLQGKGFNGTDDENRMGFMHVGVQQFHDEDQPKMYRSN